jgi:hypothetical protein
MDLVGHAHTKSQWYMSYLKVIYFSSSSHFIFHFQKQDISNS